MPPPVALSLRPATMGRFRRMTPVEPKKGWSSRRAPVGRHQPVASSVGRRSHAHHRFVEAEAPVKP